MRAALLDRLLRAQTFAVIYDRDGRGADKEALLLEGVLIEADSGSEALRFFLGSGLGRPHLAATFRLVNGEGTARVAFSAVSDNPGPTGPAGHWQPLSMEDLAREMGRTAADAILRWSEGKELTAASMF